MSAGSIGNRSERGMADILRYSSGVNSELLCLERVNCVTGYTSGFSNFSGKMFLWIP